MSHALLFRMARALRPVDRLKARLGVLRIPDDVPEDVAVLLVAAAERFIRAGGHLTAAQWIDLSVVERGAFVTAGDRVRADTAVVHGTAATGLAGLLAVHGVLDGGRAAENLAEQARSLEVRERMRDLVGSRKSAVRR